MIELILIIAVAGVIGYEAYAHRANLAALEAKGKALLLALETRLRATESHLGIPTPPVAPAAPKP